MPVLLDHHHLSILGEGDDINPVIGVNDVELPRLICPRGDRSIDLDPEYPVIPVYL